MSLDKKFMLDKIKIPEIIKRKQEELSEKTDCGD